MENFNQTIFSDTTQKLYASFFISIFLVMFVVLIPNNTVSKYVTVLCLTLLIFVMYLNIQQTQALQTAKATVQRDETKSQLDLNIVYSYFFTFSLGLLILFVMNILIRGWNFRLLTWVPLSFENTECLSYNRDDWSQLAHHSSHETTLYVFHSSDNSMLFPLHI